MIWVSGTWFQEEDETENESKTKSRNRLGNGSIPSPSPVALSLQELDPSHFFAISVFSHFYSKIETAGMLFIFFIFFVHEMPWGSKVF